MNSIFSRKKDYQTEHLSQFIPFFQELEVSHVIISGDLSTTSQKNEFEAAAEFVNAIQKSGIEVFTLPGNHDHYTQSAYKKKLFYNYFNANHGATSNLPPFNLKEHQIATHPLGHHWWLILLDTAIATNLISSRGYFSKELEERLKRMLKALPSNDSVILANHFPFFQQESPRKILERGEALKALVEHFPNIKLYLHGHTHRQTLADLRGNKLPIIFDSGSTTHKDTGTWNLIDITTTGCEVRVFDSSHMKTLETPIKQTSFTW